MYAIRSYYASLDALIAGCHLRAPDFIKLDIEGAEGLAVSGMARTLASVRPTLLIEVHGRRAAEATFQAVDWNGYRFLV